MAKVQFNTTQENIEWRKAKYFKAGDICIGKKGAIYIIVKCCNMGGGWAYKKIYTKAVSVVSGQFSEGQTMMRIMREDETVTIKN